jgi:uridine kinase
LLGDQIHIKSDYFATATSLCNAIRMREEWNIHKLVIGIAGESGSGKSVTAVCLQKAFAEYDRKALIIHQDDYFKLPPATNHQKRQQDLTWIGPGEVHLDLIASHIQDFVSHTEQIEVPLVHYQANEILSEIQQLSGYDVLIVEGTYVLTLPVVHIRVYMDRTFEETRQARLDRGRDVPSAFLEEVLTLEHNLIRPQKNTTHFVIDKNYHVQKMNAK